MQERVEKLIRTYERYFAPFMFVGGFLLDTLTLRRIDFWLDHLVLIAYLLVAGISILALNAYEAGRIRFHWFASVAPFLPVFMQFGFGGLFSAFLIFYTKSGAILTNWIFIFLLAAILIGNERFRKRYERFVFHISVYFIALFSYSIFLLPIIFKRMGDTVFLTSGLLAIALTGIFVAGISLFLPRQIIRESHRRLAISIGGIFVIFNLFYFTGIIPPIPLSLKEAGVYHSVLRSKTGAYELIFEKAPWYLPLQNTNSVYHWRREEAAFFYSSIFAPTDFKEKVTHRWARYDKNKKEWVVTENIPFDVYGGRDGGYRGYSYKTAVLPGVWRVDVLTKNGSLLGRKKFTIIETKTVPALETALR